MFWNHQYKKGSNKFRCMLLKHRNIQKIWRKNAAGHHHISEEMKYLGCPNDMNKIITTISKK